MNYKHGKRHSKLYAVWSAMCSRCGNPANPAYPNYGGRGIVVCDRWRIFANFLHDMGEPDPGETLERINNDGPYSQANCRWATRSEQGRNKRNTRMVTANGKTQSVAAWADESGIAIGTICARLAKGWDEVAAVTFPLVRHRANARSGLPAYAFGAEHGVVFKEPA